MKVLYIGNYRDGTGYGQAAEDYILSLDSVGVNVVCRPLKFNKLNHVPHKRIEQLEKKSADNCNVVIQHTLPVHMQYDSNFDLNIALFAYETSSFRMSGWQNHLNNMDCCVVINNQMIESCRNSGVKPPIYVVPHARDFSIYTEKFEKLKQVEDNTFKNDFIFYTIGEQKRRKNLSSLLKAYFLEFSRDENVCLIVKTNHDDKEDFTKYCNSISSGLNIKRPPRVFCIKERLSNNAMYKLHSSCDAFVQASYGEAWSIPAFDAMGFGKTPIVTNCSGYKDYLNDNVGWMVDCHKEFVFGEERIFDGIYDGSEYWWSIDIHDLRRKMRDCYSMEDIRKSKATSALDRAYEFSHEKVGLNFLKVIKHASKKEKTNLGRHCKL